MPPYPDLIAGSTSTAPDEGLHQTVSRIAAARPDAVALLSGPREVTYGELDRTANSWAAQLVARGAGPGERVAVLMEREVRLVVALLAVLKTGAAYAALDPRWPNGRLRDACADLRPPVLVTDLPRAVPDHVPVWTPPGGTVPTPADFRPAATTGTDPACVFFTSGTTGRPKGVLTPHRATARLFGPDSFASFTAETVTALAAAVPWDAFSLELWSALLNGGAVLIVEEPYLSPDALRAAVAHHGVNTVWLTSSLLNLVVDEDIDAFTGLGQVMTGGERLSPAHVRRLLRRHPDITVVNGYGPVESTVFATAHRVTAADCERDTGIPLGRAVPGSRVFVMDGDRECAAGEVGEIRIAGEGLALGYLNDAELTARKFVALRDVRAYRTGDLGWWDESGVLHYRGRADRQLKVRGHRVEPAEVERQVEDALPNVRQCRVLPRRDDVGAVRDLVAFCVPTRPGDPLAGATAVLRSALVSYQRPALVVPVHGFPVTNHGKLDERALLDLVPGASSEQAPTDSDPPVTDDTLAAVLDAFGDVLRLGAVPADTPFTDLGGTSLDAGRVCARLTARLSRTVPVSLLHRHLTARGLADWLRATPAVAPSAVDAEETVPLSPMQLVYLARSATTGDLTSHCLLTWVIDGPLDRGALQAAIDEVHRRHEPLRAAYSTDPRPHARLGQAPPPRLGALPVSTSTEAAIKALRGHLSDELDITDGEVWRAALAPVRGGSTAVLGCVVHHIAFDGRSEAVLAEELGTAYSTARGATRPARPLPPSLAAVRAEGIRGRDLVDPAAVDEHVRALAGCPPLRWPPGETSAAPAAPEHLAVTLSPASVTAIDEFASHVGVTRFTVLLSQWAATLAEVVGQQDFTVGVPVSPRTGAGVDQAIGCHINMSCVRLRGTALRGDPAAVAEVGRLVQAVFAVQDVPHAEIARGLRTGRAPLYRTLFALQDNPVPHLDLEGLRTAFVRQPYLALPLDLHTELWPDPGGGLRLEVSFDPAAVFAPVAEEITKRLAERLRHTSWEHP